MMRPKLKNILKRVLNLGVEDDQEFDQFHRVKILNGFALIIIIFVLFNAYWGIAVHDVRIIAANYFSFISMLFVLFLNSRKKYKFARTLFFLTLAIHIVAAQVILDTGTKYFLFPLFIAAAFIIENKFFLSLYFILLLFLFVLAEGNYLTGFAIETKPEINQTITIVDGIIAFILSIVFISLFRKQYIRNRSLIISQNQLLKETAEVSREHAELASLLLSEMNHRVKNNLQLISSLLNIQANQMEDRTAKNAIQDSIQRISSIALIHRQLYKYKSKQSAKIDMAEYIKELIPFIKKSLIADENGIEIRMNVQNIVLPVEEAVSVGLILNETITNSIKHGLKDQKNKVIKLDVRKNRNDKIRIVVSDSGSGIQRMTDGKNVGFGYELINALVSNYEGSMVIDEEKNKITIELVCGIQSTTPKQLKNVAAL